MNEANLQKKNFVREYDLKARDAHKPLIKSRRTKRAQHSFTNISIGEDTPPPLMTKSAFILANPATK